MEPRRNVYYVYPIVVFDSKCVVLGPLPRRALKVFAK